MLALLAQACAQPHVIGVWIAREKMRKAARTLNPTSRELTDGDGEFAHVREQAKCRFDLLPKT